MNLILDYSLEMFRTNLKNFDQKMNNILNCILDIFDNSSGSFVDGILTVELNMNIKENNKTLSLYISFALSLLLVGIQFNNDAFDVFYIFVTICVASVYFIQIHWLRFEEKLMRKTPFFPEPSEDGNRMRISLWLMVWMWVYVYVRVHIFWRQCMNTVHTNKFFF